MTDAVNQLAERIEAIEWDEDTSRAPLQVRLAKEFLRRSALWAEALGRQEEWPFFDIAEAIDPQTRADAAVVSRLRTHLHEVHQSGWSELTCTRALHFAALPAAVVEKFGLPNPFEPLISLFENGGVFTVEAGTINIDFVYGVWMGPIAGWLTAEPVIEV